MRTSRKIGKTKTREALHKCSMLRIALKSLRYFKSKSENLYQFFLNKRLTEIFIYFYKTNVVLLVSFLFFLFSHSKMISKLPQFSPSFVLQHRPLTKLTLDNKIRAMISQFHPHERYFILVSHENTLDRIYTINSIRKECFKFKLPFHFIKSSIMMEDRIKIDNFSLMNKQTDEYIYTYKKVTEWLEHLDYNRNKKRNK